MQIFEIIKIIYSVVFVLFLPGFLISLVLFSKNQIDLIERMALSFALSIAVVPLIVFYVSLAGIKINFTSVHVIIITILLNTSLILLIKHLKKHEKN